MCSLHMLVISEAVCLMHICCNCSVTNGGFCKRFSTTMQLQQRTVATVAKTDRAFDSLAVLGKYASKFKRAKDVLTTAVPNLNPTDASIMSTWMDLDGHGEPLKLAVSSQLNCRLFFQSHFILCWRLINIAAWFSLVFL